MFKILQRICIKLRVCFNKPDCGTQRVANQAHILLIVLKNEKNLPPRIVCERQTLQHGKQAVVGMGFRSGMDIGRSQVHCYVADCLRLCLREQQLLSLINISYLASQCPVGQKSGDACVKAVRAFDARNIAEKLFCA